MGKEIQSTRYILILLLLALICSVAGAQSIDVYEKIYWWDVGETYSVSMNASESMSANYDMTWPILVGDPNSILGTDGAGILRWFTFDPNSIVILPDPNDPNDPNVPMIQLPTFTPGSIPFADPNGDLTEDNPNLFYDDVNDFMGVNTNSPRDRIEVANRIVFDPVLFNTLYGEDVAPGLAGYRNQLGGYNTGVLMVDSNDNAAWGYKALGGLADVGPPATPSTAIYTLADLNDVRLDLSLNYHLMNDINAADTSTWNGGRGWIPIGFPGTEYKGTFDGRNYTISNLYQNTTVFGEYTSFISDLGDTTVAGQNGHVKNLKLTNFEIANSRMSATGLLVGTLGVSSTITDCYVQGSINVNIGHFVGGLVGKASNDSVITRCGAVGSIAPWESGNDTGGLVAFLDNGVIITDCYAQVSIARAGGACKLGINQGGLVGNDSEKNSTITNCYAAASIQYQNSCYTYSTDSYPVTYTGGGIVGNPDIGSTYSSVYFDQEAAQDTYPDAAQFDSGYMNDRQRAYLNQAMTSGHYHVSHDGNTTGEIAWNANSATVQAAIDAAWGASEVIHLFDGGDLWDQNSHWKIMFYGSTYGASPQADITFDMSAIVPGGTTATIDGIPSTGVVPLDDADITSKTTAQMKAQATFSGWNFTTVWTITEGSSYPSLRDPVIPAETAEVHRSAAFGNLAGARAAAGSDDSLYLGNYSGSRNQTDPNVFYLDNLDRSTYALEKTNGMMYGYFSVTLGDQWLNINADVNVPSITPTDLTAFRLVATDASKTLVSVGDLTSWVAGVANETDVVDDGDGTITVGIVDPLIVGKGGTGAATITDGGVMLGSGTGAVTPMAVLADSEFIVGDGTTDPVAESGDTARTSLGVGTGDSPTFTGLTLSGLGDTHVVYSSSGVLTGDSALTWNDSTKVMHLDSLTGLIDLGQYGNSNVTGLMFRGGNSAKNVYLRPNLTGEVVEMQDKDGDAIQAWDAFGSTGFPNIEALHTVTFDTSSTAKSTVFIRGRHSADAIVIIKETNDADPGRTFHITDKNDNIIHAIMGGNGATPFFVGLGESAPETPLEITFATPVTITGHPDTHSDADESGLFEITGKREDGAGTEIESGHIKMWHDGAGVNDQLTKMTLGVNTGAGVVDVVEIDSGGNTNIGDLSGGNKTVVEADGTIRFDGDATVWDDYVTPLTRALFGGSSNDPTLTKIADDGAGSAGVWGFVFSDGDEVLATVQMPHRWKEGSTIYPHIHLFAMTDVDPTDNFDLEIEYWWSDINEDFPANTTLVNTEHETGVNSQYKHQLADLTAAGIDGSGHTLSSVLMIRIERVAAAADNYAGGICIMDFDVHYEIDTIGSRVIASK